MKIAWLLPIALLLLSPTSVPAADRVKACTPASAEKASIAGIAGAPDRWIGHCVTVRGAMADGQLIADADAYYRPPEDILDPSSNGGVLGIDGDRPTNWRMTEVTGRVQDCETTRNAVQATAGPGQIAWTSGYCHSWDGAYLWVVAHRDRGPIHLLRAVTAKAGWGDLEAAPADWPHRAFAEGYRRRFLDALKAGDFASLAKLHTPYAENPDDGQAVAKAILAPNSVFREIASAKGEVQTVFLTYRDLDADDAKMEQYRTTICFCREADCTGRWPIDQRDTRGLVSHPYACTELTPWLLSPKEGEIPVMITEWADGAQGVEPGAQHAGLAQAVGGAVGGFLVDAPALFLEGLVD
eukprot:gene17399-17228_t